MLWSGRINYNISHLSLCMFFSGPVPIISNQSPGSAQNQGDILKCSPGRLAIKTHKAVLYEQTSAAHTRKRQERNSNMLQFSHRCWSQENIFPSSVVVQDLHWSRKLKMICKCVFRIWNCTIRTRSAVYGKWKCPQWSCWIQTHRVSLLWPAGTTQTCSGFVMGRRNSITGSESW